MNESIHKIMAHQFTVPAEVTFVDEKFLRPKGVERAKHGMMPHNEDVIDPRATGSQILILRISREFKGVYPKAGALQPTVIKSQW